MSSGSNKDYPLVSIVTPSYNQGKFLEKTIRSVLCQTYARIQYIVVDSLSTDETPQILEAYKNRIDTLIQEKDKGQSDGLNKGFKHAKGEVLAYLNSDDCFASPSVVTEAVDFLMQNPQVDLVYGRRTYIDADGHFSFNLPFADFEAKTLYESCFLPQECCFWRKSIFEKAGPYINDEYHLAMDYELWLRFLESGAKFQSINRSFGLFRWYSDQKSQADWLTAGVSEVGQLHEKYLGRKIDSATMSDLYWKHFTGISPLRNKKQDLLRRRIWEDFMSHSRDSLVGAPIDAWVYHRDFRSLPCFDTEHL